MASNKASRDPRRKSGAVKRPDASGPKRVIGGFELIEKVGAGAMGAVFKARQISLDRIVALKILPKRIAQDEKFITRFQREARASGNLNHPHIVQGIDVGHDSASGLWYFAMEYVDGESVRDLLKKKERLTEKKALEITRQVAQALECAQRAQIVHRDIKPDNIMLTKRGDAKLADLGLARRSNEDASVTQSGMAVGTPHYISPEQAQGHSDIDVRADIYSLGATLFHMVTGETPFDGEAAPVIMVKHIQDKPPLAHEVDPEVSEGCSRLIDRMLRKDPKKRFKNAQELIAEIDAVSRSMASAPPPPPGAKAKGRSRGKSKHATKMGARPVEGDITGQPSLTGAREGRDRTTGRLRPVRGDTTGPRGPVRARSIKSRSENNSTMLIAGGAAAALLIPMLLFALGGSSQPPPRRQNRTANRPPPVIAKPRTRQTMPVADSSNQSETKRGAESRPVEPAPDYVTNSAQTHNIDSNDSSARDVAEEIRKAAREQAARRMAEQRLRSRYKNMLDRFDAAALSGKFGDARKIAEEARANVDFKMMEEELEALERVAIAFDRISKAKESAPEQLMKDVTFVGGIGPGVERVIKVDKKKVRYARSFKINNEIKEIETAEEVSKLPLPIRSLHHAAFRGDFEPINLDEQIALGLLVLSDRSSPFRESDLKKAGKAFEAAGNHPWAGRYKALFEKQHSAFLAAQGPPRVLMLVSSKETYASDQFLKSRLEELGCIVAVKADRQAEEADFDGKALIVISSTVSGSVMAQNHQRLADLPVPILAWEPKVYDLLGMTSASGWERDQTQANFSSKHFKGLQPLLRQAGVVAWGKPAPSVLKMAVLPGDSDKALVFAYTKGTQMVGRKAPAKRVGMFLSDETVLDWTPQGASLFNGAVRWCVPRLAALGRPDQKVPPAAARKSILMVVGKYDYPEERDADNEIVRRLRQRNFNVVRKREVAVDAEADVIGQSMVMVSSTVSAKNLKDKLRNVAVPVLTWDPNCYPHFGMTARADTAHDWSSSLVDGIILRAPLGPQLQQGMVKVFDKKVSVCWGWPTMAAKKLAVLPGQPNKAVIFTYSKGDSMVGLLAPEKRVGLFLADVTARSLTDNGWALFDAAVDWCVNP